MKISKKAGGPLVDALPGIIILLVAAAVILLLVYTFYKGGLAFIAKPPVTGLPT